MPEQNPPSPGLGRRRSLRLALFVTVLSQCWLMIFLAFELEPVETRNEVLDALGLGGALAAGAMVVAGLVLCGSAINDMLDLHVDQAMAGGGAAAMSERPDRRRALAAAVLWLLIAIGASLALGQRSVVLTMVTVMGVLFYNIAGRFLPAVGIILLALLLALVMFTPNPSMRFAWPLALTFSHVVVCATADYWAAEKRPRLRWQDGWGIVIGWAFWFFAILTGMQYREPAATSADAGQPQAYDVIWIGPAIAAGAFVVVAILLLRRGPVRLREGRPFATLGLVWLNIYAVAWASSLGSLTAVCLLGLLLAVTAIVGLRHHLLQR